MNGLQSRIISKALDEPEKLTEWEYDRVNEWADYPKDRELSEKQNAVLNRIWEKLSQ